MNKRFSSRLPFLLLAAPGLCVALAADGCRSFESGDHSSSLGDAGTSGRSSDGGEVSSDQTTDVSGGGIPPTNGGAGDSGQGGAAGLLANNGVGGALGGEETLLTPACNLAVSWAVNVKNVSALAMSGTPYNSPNAQMYATDPDVSVVAVRWSGYNGEPGTWENWSCFDALPSPERIAAVSLSDFQVHIFVVTAAGNLFVRRSFGNPVQWSGWLPMGLPTRHSVLSDVAVSGAENTHLFVVDLGAVFYRYLIDPKPASATYGAWTRVTTPSDAVFVTSIRRLDNRQQLFIVDDSEELWTTTALSSVPGSGFEAWQDLGTSCTATRDLDATIDAEGQLTVYCLDGDSTLHSRRTVPDGGGGAAGAGGLPGNGVTPGEWQEWTLLGAPEPYSLTAITAYDGGNHSIRVVGLAPDGTTFVSSEDGFWELLKGRP